MVTDQIPTQPGPEPNHLSLWLDLKQRHPYCETRQRIGIPETINDSLERISLVKESLNQPD